LRELQEDRAMQKMIALVAAKAWLGATAAQ
jgi:hypothetical protein